MTQRRDVAPIIRPAHPGEAALLSALALRSKAHWGYDDAFLECCRDELTITSTQIESGLTFVLVGDGALLGFHSLSVSGHERMELEHLFVEPSVIGHGHGRTLLDHARRSARERGCRVLEIQADPHAAAFYRAAGGRVVAERGSDSIPGRVLPLFELEV